MSGDVTLWPNLSGGEGIDLLGRLRGGLAALASDVELLVLDEPTSGLDPLMEELRDRGRTSIVAELAGPPRSLRLVPGVLDAQIDGTWLRAKVATSELAGVLRFLASVGVRSLTSRPPHSRSCSCGTRA